MSDGILTEHGQVGGIKQSDFESIMYGKANRSQREQIESVAASKIKKRLEKGYKRTQAEAESMVGKGMNEMGFPRPMLAAKFNPEKIDPSEYFYQPKLDGHRCLIYKDGDSVQAYSRNGKPIDTIIEIVEHIKLLPVKRVVLDGELYDHSTDLQQISSFVKRRQEETKKLTYWAYDIVSNDPFGLRNAMLHDYTTNTNQKIVKYTPTWYGISDIDNRLRKFKADGFEGIMLRHPDMPYEDGKRSKSLLKVKSRLDDEFLVVDITENKIGGAILHCKIGDKIFSTPAPGTHEQKKFTYVYREKFIGNYVRVEYPNLTRYGVPFHPVATMWRDKNEE